MATITFDFEAFKRFLRRASPSGGDDGLYGVVDKTNDSHKYFGGDAWKNLFDEGEIYFACFGNRRSMGIIGNIQW